MPWWPSAPTTPRPRTWDAITNGERILLVPARRGRPAARGRYQLEGNAGGEITACDPPAHLALTWEFGDGVTWVDVHLSDDPGGGTRLRLEHAAALDDLDHWEQFGPGVVGIGWYFNALGLAEHLRTGESVSAESEIVAGPAGAAFTARSSDAWCEADVAAGTPEAVAPGRTAPPRPIPARPRRTPDARARRAGDPVRRRVLELLAEGELTSGAITGIIREEFGISQLAVSQHLGVLRSGGFVHVRADGPRRVYRSTRRPCGRSTPGSTTSAASGTSTSTPSAPRSPAASARRKEP